jgi:hypothetical protein
MGGFPVDGRIEHQVVVERERVHDPLIVTEVKAGVVRRDGDSRLFIGMTLVGWQLGSIDRDEGCAGDVVLTVELAEAMVEIVGRAIARAKGGWTGAVL